MKTLVYKPKIGDKLAVGGVQGKVIEITDYYQLVYGLHGDRLEEYNNHLRAIYGDDYKNLHYEVFIKAQYVKKYTKYTRGEIVVFAGYEIQKAKIK